MLADGAHFEEATSPLPRGNLGLIFGLCGKSRCAYRRPRVDASRQTIMRAGAEKAE
jgi:hypothetical protein